jgi:hypothetical protein
MPRPGDTGDEVRSSTITKWLKRRVVTRVIVEDIMVTRQGGEEGTKLFSGDSV